MGNNMVEMGRGWGQDVGTDGDGDRTCGVGWGWG